MEWKNPLLLLFGIGISNVGAWVYLIALNLIILDMTGSPLAVSILYILLPIATLFTNFWSGTFIDRLNKKKLMIFLDLIRALFIFTLPFLDSLFLIYLVVFLINIASSIFEPTSMVYMTKLISKTDRQRFNAMRNFINSCGFILGPSIAGILFMIGSPYLAILMNSIALFLSAIVIFLLPNVEIRKSDMISEKVNISIILNDWKRILKFSKKNIHVTLVYVLFSVITVFMTALDSLEAAFATDVLSYDFIWASIGFFTLTFFLSFANTGFLTFYQNNVPVNIMGRFSGVLGMLEAFLVILVTVTIGLSADLFEIRPIYIIGSFTFLVLGIIINFVVLDKSLRHYYEQVRE
ncbi:MFS transporter [Bacillus sp. 1P06AnD]|uniref:MFS transporter n=1 Tax=Bacillus sp. 1P06AnD TaxID=3132208 RepID=UPI0039A02118